MDDKHITTKQQLARNLFFVIFLQIFCFSGLISFISIVTEKFDYRLGITVSILIIIIIFLSGIKIDKVAVMLGVLATVVVLSGIHNQTSPQQTIYFLRYVIFTYLGYNVVQLCVTTRNIKQIIIWCIRIALVQLPIILFQKAIYPKLPVKIHERIAAIDIGTGTFDINGDAAMTFFVVLVIIFLLFNLKQNSLIKRKEIILAWLTLTVFVAESEISKIIVLLVWAFFFIAKLNNKKIFITLLVLLMILGVFASFGVFNETFEVLFTRINKSLDTSSVATEAYLSGNYARGAALKYLIDKGLFLLGDGPSKYFDIQSRSKLVGNNGHFFIFYSEVGQLGWLCSVAVFFFIGFPVNHGKIKVRWSNILNFGSLMLLSLTTSLMGKFEVIIIYCIMSMTYKLTESSVKRTVNETKFPVVSSAASIP